MRSYDYYRRHFKKLYINAALKGSPLLDRPLDLLSGIDVAYITGRDDIPASDLNARTLFVELPKSSIVSACPGSEGHLCCNYLTIDLYEGCIIGCTYCIMRSYLNFSPVTVNLAVEQTIHDVITIAAHNPGHTIRIGTGETGDSLDLDPVFDISRRFISAFAPYPDIHFECKTKTSRIGHILDLPEKGNAVIGFSLNPERITINEDGCAASLQERLDAAATAAAHAYRVAFHFDPVFHYDAWDNDYRGVIERLSVIPEERVAWISIGTFRYPRGLKEKIGGRWYLSDEFVACADGKFRYIQRERKTIYRTLLAHIRRIFPHAPVYFCMESAHVWESVCGAQPENIAALEPIFTKSEL